MDILLACVAVLAGLGLLTIGADRLIVGACALARRAHLSEAVIGATIVAGGTSMPELVASVAGALADQYGLALGNVVGSNSFNVGGILGLVALVAPMAVASEIAGREWRVMAAVSVALCAGAVLLGVIPRWLALVFLGGWIAALVWSIRSSRNAPTAESAVTTVPALPTMPMWVALGWIALGIICLSSGGQALVWGSVVVAKTLGVSDALIGLTIVAAGTSAPELVTSLLAARRGQHQIAVANIVGSNTFNILLILGITGLFGTIPVDPGILHRDLWVMLAFALCLPLCWGRRRIIGRTAGAALLAGYLVYLGFLVAAALR